MSEETGNKVHYVCTGGCQGIAPQPGVCGAPTCPKHAMPLTECHCTDGRHFEAYQADGDDAADMSE